MADELDKKRVLQIGLAVFLGNVATLLLVWLAFAVIGRLFGFD